jgi:hypothetical protein
VSRRQTSYGLIPSRHRQAAIAFAGLCLLGGCGSVSVLGPSADAGPVSTSSVASVDVQQPLPGKLAYSDATKIGQTASEALRDLDSTAAATPASSTDWVNAATGSSGTLVDIKQDQTQDVSRPCKLFNTIVTSFAGVHRYSGKVCRNDSGRSVVQLSDGTPQGET